MLIRLKCYVSGPHYTYKTGQMVDHPNEADARRWIAAGIAEVPAAGVIARDQRVEHADGVPASERAVSRARRGARTKPN